MLTEGVTGGLTNICNTLLVAIIGLAQPALLVITTVIRSLFCNVLVVKLAAFVIALLPFTFH